MSAFPAANASAKDWTKALELYFGVGHGMPLDWHVPLPARRLAAIAQLLRDVVLAPNNAAAIALFNKFEPQLELRADAVVCHAGNFLFAMQDVANSDQTELIALNWTQLLGSVSYIAHTKVPRASVSRKGAERCFRTLLPVQETSGMAAYVNCTLDDGRTVPTAVIVVDQSIPVGGDPYTLHLRVFSNCDLGFACGHYIVGDLTTRGTIAETRGYPQSRDIFIVTRGHIDGAGQISTRVSSNNPYDAWPISKEAMASIKAGQGLILATDNSSQNEALFQLSVDGAGIDEVSFGRRGMRRICSLPPQLGADFQMPAPTGLRYRFIDASVGRGADYLYVAYEAVEGGAPTIAVRRISRKQATPAAFLKGELSYSETKKASERAIYAFRRGNTFVAALQGRGFETTPLVAGSTEGRELYPSARANLAQIYVVPLKNDASFKGRAFLRQLDDDDD